MTGKDIRFLVDAITSDNAIGNTLEVAEAVLTLNGDVKADLTEICIFITSEIISMAFDGSAEQSSIQT